jgi:putative endonuclease
LTSNEDGSSARRSTGRHGEDIATLYLARRGCAILDRNWHTQRGEVDIIARCPGDPPVLAFIEVRTRHGREGLAEESISPRKANSMALAAYAYMTARNLDPESTPWRIDLVAIAMSDGKVGTINWVRGAVDEEVLRTEG